MARIRTIKPEFPQSESMGRVSRDARLCFIQMWTLADDSGRLRGNSRMLASLLFPYDDDASTHIDSWVKELENEGCVLRYSVNGTSYIQINAWSKHQKIDKPSISKIPEPPTTVKEDSRILANVRECSSLEGKGKDQGKDQGEGEEKNPRAPRSAPISKPDDVSYQVWSDWCKLRKDKKASVTETVLREARAEAAKAYLPLERFLSIWCVRGSQGLQADWLKPNERGRPFKASNEDANAEAARILGISMPGYGGQEVIDA